MISMKSRAKKMNEKSSSISWMLLQSYVAAVHLHVCMSMHVKHKAAMPCCAHKYGLVTEYHHYETSRSREEEKIS